MNSIRKDLGATKNTTSIPSTFHDIFLNIIECARTGSQFSISNIQDNNRTHRCPLISLDSPQAQIVADLMEAGLSIEKTFNLLNEHEYEQGNPKISRSAVYNLLQRLKPKIINCQKRKQGRNNPQDDWSRARYLFTKQMSIRFGKLTEPFPRQPCMDIRQIGSLDIHQVVLWDETHRKCVIGGISASRMMALNFARDSNGKLDMNGEYSDKKLEILNCKYEKEGRFGLGCAVIQPIDSNGNNLPPEGMSCQIFDYSGKTIISLNDFEKFKKQEFQRISTLSDKTKNWIHDPRNPQDLYDDDDLLRLDRVGKRTKEKLLLANISSVGDLKRNNQPVPGISDTSLQFLRDQAQLAKDEKAPTKIDHRKAANPYQSRYGDEWETVLKKSSYFSSQVVITDYIEHIMHESKKVMQGTKYQDDWYFYHDALSLMTSVKTKEWMKSKGYYKHWILAKNNLYAQDSNGLQKKYGDNPIGNSPEFMPWDSHLNQDLHSAHDQHVALTRHLPEDDPLKFSGSTPSRMASFYHHLIQICPSSKRIQQDCYRVLDAFEVVREARGCIVSKFGKRSGKRGFSGSNCSRGGKRMKKPYEPSQYLHPSVTSVSQAMIGKSISLFDNDADDDSSVDLPLIHAIANENKDFEGDDVSSEVE